MSDQYPQQRKSGDQVDVSKPQLLLIGAGGHSRSCIEVIEQEGEFAIAGLVGLQNESHSKQLGYSVIGTDADLTLLAEQYKYALITVGQIKSPAIRKSLYLQAVKLGFYLPTIIAPSACVSRHAVLGLGNIVMPGVILNAGVKIGDNCIINSRALIEHDATVGDHSHVSTGTIVNGSVRIGEGCFIGSGSIIKQNISIGNNSIVAMGIAVKHDVAPNTKLSSNVP